LSKHSTSVLLEEEQQRNSRFHNQLYSDVTKPECEEPVDKYEQEAHEPDDDEPEEQDPPRWRPLLVPRRRRLSACRCARTMTRCGERFDRAPRSSRLQGQLCPPILWAAANGVHRKFTRKIWYFFWYFLSSSEYRAEKQTRRKALAAYLPLAHSYG